MVVSKQESCVQLDSSFPQRQMFGELCLCLLTQATRGEDVLEHPLQILPPSPAWADGNYTDIQTMGGKIHALFTSQFLFCAPNSIQKRLNFHLAVNIIYCAPLLS